MTKLIANHREQIIAWCVKWQVAQLSVFGSALRDDFGPHSDIDFMVTFAPQAQWSVFSLNHMEDELAVIVGRPVDLIEKSAIEQSPNYIRRNSILSSAELVYAP